MDKVDKKLIKLLNENARYSLKELSEQVYLSSPAVASRIEKLENSGIISGYHAEINHELLGYHISAYISVAMQPKKKQTFLPLLADYANVLECSVVSGDNSLIIKAIFKSTQDLEDFIAMVQKYGQTQTQVVFSNPIPHRSLVEAD